VTALLIENATGIFTGRPGAEMRTSGSIRVRDGVIVEIGALNAEPNERRLDANGCVTCSCDAVTNRTCTASTDCAEVPADCCGCALGGSDTAVPSSEVSSYEAGLDCPSMPSCPGVSTCQTDLMPTCVQGACALQPALPSDACGRPDLPTCPTGEICALNSDPLASAQGVGACIPAM